MRVRGKAHQGRAYRIASYFPQPLGHDDHAEKEQAQPAQRLYSYKELVCHSCVSELHYHRQCLCEKFVHTGFRSLHVTVDDVDQRVFLTAFTRCPVHDHGATRV